MERFHRSFKTFYVLAWLVLTGLDWLVHLPLVMLGLRTTPREETGFSAAEAVYGAPLCLPVEFLESVDLPPRDFLDRIQSAPCGLTLPPPHHVSPSSACVPAALASAEYMLFARTPPNSLSLSCTMPPTEF